jgi:hypothetical protein
MLRFLKTTVEAGKDVTITEEVVAEKEEAQADLAVEVVAEVLFFVTKAVWCFQFLNVRRQSTRC